MRRLALIATLVLAPASAALSQEAAATADGEKVIKTHAIALFGEPALPADFAHYPYVNPDAPKGGEISFGAVGGFDSYNPFTHRGRAIALAVILVVAASVLLLLLRLVARSAARPGI